jgi:hypothetical protein
VIPKDGVAHAARCAFPLPYQLLLLHAW